MRVSRRMPVVVVLTLATAAAAAAQPATGAGPTDAQVKARVDALLAKMRLEEKVGQLEQIAGATVHAGSEAARAGDPSAARARCSG